MGAASGDERAAAIDTGAKAYADLNDSLSGRDDDAVDGAISRLDELRRAHADVLDLHEMLAFGLFNALIAARDRAQLDRRDALYARLRSLQRELPAEESIAKACAKALFDQMLEAERAGETERLERLTADMQTILDGLDGEFVPTEPLSNELLHWLIDTGDEAIEVSHFWDDETPDLHIEQARLGSMEDPDARRILAKALARGIESAVERDDVAERDAIVSELSALRASYPDDRETAGRLAFVLIHAIGHARAHGEEERGHELEAMMREVRDWLKATQ